LVPPG